MAAKRRYIWVDDETWERWNALAKERGITVSMLLRESTLIRETIEPKRTKPTAPLEPLDQDFETRVAQDYIRSRDKHAREVLGKANRGD